MSCPRKVSGLAAWTRPDLAWAGACRSAWVAPGPCALGRAWYVARWGARLGASPSSPELAGAASDWRRERKEKRRGRKERKKEEKKRREERGPGEKEKRERKRKKKFECSGFSKVET